MSLASFCQRRADWLHKGCSYQRWWVSHSRIVGRGVWGSGWGHRGCCGHGRARHAPTPTASTRWGSTWGFGKVVDVDKELFHIGSLLKGKKEKNSMVIWALKFQSYQPVEDQSWVYSGWGLWEMHVIAKSNRLQRVNALLERVRHIRWPLVCCHGILVHANHCACTLVMSIKLWEPKPGQ